MASFAELRPTLDGAVGFAAVAVGKPGTVYTLGLHRARLVDREGAPGDGRNARRPGRTGHR